MEKTYSKLTITQCAAKFNVSRQVVWAWIKQKRMSVEEPAKGVYLISAMQERPRAVSPWGLRRRVR